MEQKNISLTILGIVAIIAIVGLVLLFSGGMTGEVPRGIPDRCPESHPIGVGWNQAQSMMGPPQYRDCQDYTNEFGKWCCTAIGFE